MGHCDGSAFSGGRLALFSGLAALRDSGLSVRFAICFPLRRVAVEVVSLCVGPNLG
jgi:hypothetical protein